LTVQEAPGQLAGNNRYDDPGSAPV